MYMTYAALWGKACLMYGVTLPTCYMQSNTKQMAVWAEFLGLGYDSFSFQFIL